MKVYDVLPAHKKQASKEKLKSNLKHDPDYNVIYEERPHNAQVGKEKHSTKQHGSWSSRASSIMHNPESVYISREEVLRNLQNTNAAKMANGNKQPQSKNKYLPHGQTMENWEL